MIATADKTRENRCRRHAHRLGLELRKSRAKRLNINDWGEYMIVDSYFNTIVAGQKFEMGLDSVEKFLNEYEEDLKAKR